MEDQNENVVEEVVEKDLDVYTIIVSAVYNQFPFCFLSFFLSLALLCSGLEALFNPKVLISDADVVAFLVSLINCVLLKWVVNILFALTRLALSVLVRVGFKSMSSSVQQERLREEVQQAHQDLEDMMFTVMMLVIMMLIE